MKLTAEQLKVIEEVRAEWLAILAKVSLPD